jgi:hypothetical protein
MSECIPHRASHPPPIPRFEGWTMHVVPTRNLRLGEHVLYAGYLYEVPGPNATAWARKGLIRGDFLQPMSIMLMGRQAQLVQPVPQEPVW